MGFLLYAKFFFKKMLDDLEGTCAHISADGRTHSADFGRLSEPFREHVEDAANEYGGQHVPDEFKEFECASRLD
jgi:hypothetical protein